MAKGNWSPSVIKPKARCRLCGHIVKVKDFVRLEGVYPCHNSCAVTSGRSYTVGLQMRPAEAECICENHTDNDGWRCNVCGLLSPHREHTH